MPDLRDLLNDAIERGIISADQATALVRLNEGRGVAATTSTAASETRAGLNSVTVAYLLGAFLVVFAFGWFLVDRWNALGPWGVLAVVLVYGVIFFVAFRRLEEKGFTLAASVVLVLIVALAPIVSWAVQTIAGMWPDTRYGSPFSRFNQWIALRWIITALFTILVALIILRVRTYVILMLPISVALWGLWMHLPRAFIAEPVTPSIDRWLLLANGLALCAIAGRIDRWQAMAGTRERTSALRGEGREFSGDYAFWPWGVGLLATAGGYLAVVDNRDNWMHLTLAVALALMVMSLYLRRRTHLVFGIIALFGYLAWLADDVFKDVISFPIVLAALGIGLIVATVWLQRRFPDLVDRVNQGREGNALPRMVTLGPLLFALGMVLIKIPDIKEEREQQGFRDRLHILQMHSGSLRARSHMPPPVKGGEPVRRGRRN